MICLTDIVTVSATSRVVGEWLRRLPEHYNEWHPRDHIWLKTYAGECELHEGSVARAAERIGDFTLVFSFKVTHVEVDREVCWNALFPYNLINLHGKFVLFEHDGATKLTAVSCYGWSVPILGKLLDWIIDRFFLREVLMIKHMREEGEYLKMSIENKV